MLKFNMNRKVGMQLVKIYGFCGVMGCVDGKTQFLTKKGWKNISEYDNEEIAVYNKNGELIFEKPLDYIVGNTDKWYNINTKYGINQKLSPEHNVYYITSKGNLYHKKMEDVYKQHISSKNGFCGKFITTFKNVSNFELPYTDNMIRLLLAIQADGSYIGNRYNSYNYKVNLKKERKQKRLEYLLDSCNIDYKLNIGKDDNTNKGYKTYSFYLKEGFKEFPSDWWSISKRQMEIIASEISFWDGYWENKKDQKTYYSNSKNNADYIQFVFSNLGYRSSIYLDTHRKNINYIVCGTSRNLIGIRGSKGKENISEENLENIEKKYCFTTSTGMWIARRENNIFITGNSGKGYECQKLIDNEDFVKIDFGDGLREMVWRMLNWKPKNDDEYDLFKKGQMNIPYYGKLDGRLLLQLVGTDTMRKVDDNFWVKECKRKIEDAISKGYNNICISDIRFKNELEMLFDYGWKADVKIKFCDFHSDRYNANSEHASEKLAQQLLKLGYKDLQEIKKDVLSSI